jgi:hypothetical protein
MEFCNVLHVIWLGELCVPAVDVIPCAPAPTFTA